MINQIQKLGHGTLIFLAMLGRSALVILSVLLHKPEFKKQMPLIIKQCYFIGIKSLSIIIVSGLFIGMVLGLQGYFVLTTFSAESSLGMLVAFSLLRELGPVVTGLLFAGRAGSALTAEIGLMKATEQLSGMEMMGVDPLKRILAPRFWAGLLCLPGLTSIFVSAGILGGVLVGVLWKGIDAGFFWSSIQSNVSLHHDVLNCFIKSVVFAAATLWIALFNGYDCNPTSEGISKATTSTVVASSLVILGLDFILTALMFS